MKLLVIVNGLEKGGRTKRIADTIAGLEQRGVTVDLWVFTPPDTETLQRYPVLASNEYIPDPSERPAYSTLRMRRLLRRSNPDVVHCHCEKSYFFGGIAAKLSGVKVLATCHRSNLALLFKSKTRWLWRFLIDHMVCVSGELESAISTHRLMPASKLSIIHGGVDCGGFDSLNHTDCSSQVRETFEIARESLLIVSVGHLGEIKGHAETLKALAIAKNDLPPFHLLICGSGSDVERDSVEEQIRSLELSGSVTLAGEVAEIEQCFLGADVFLLAPRNEAFGLVFVEAGYAGLPSIATRVGGIPEIIEEGRSGILVEPLNPAALADALRKLGNDPALRAQMGRSARERISQFFTIDRMIDSYCEVLNQITRSTQQQLTIRD